MSVGVGVLRSAPVVEPPSDFRGRLQHSIYSLEEERRRRSVPRSSTATLSLVAMAAIAVAIVLTPVLLDSDPQVTLAPIVADHPEPTGSGPLTALPVPATAGATLVPFSGAELWAESNALLYQHSSLYLRDREARLVQADLR